VVTNDILITGGLLYDGSGCNPVRADIAIRRDKIAAIGKLSNVDARRVIDASGLAVCPGFIDIHSHSDLTLLANPRAESKIRQGITTEIVGQCGFSPHPVRAEEREALDKLCPFISAEVQWTWQTTGEFLDTLQQSRPTVNVGTMVGHSALRALVLGFTDEPASGDEIIAMEDILKLSFSQGAMGLSLGLWYPLGAFAERAELNALATVVAESGRYVSVHMRSEAAQVLESLQEMVEIARYASDKAGRALRLQIDHLKASGRPAWGLMPRLLEAIEAARDEGIDIAFDVYPYTAGSRHLGGSFPAWIHGGGQDRFLRWLQQEEARQRLRAEQAAYEQGEAPDGPLGGYPDEIMIVAVDSEDNQWAVGKMLPEIADRMDTEPMDAACDLLVAEQGRVTVVTFTVCEDDLRLALTHPLGCFCTDGMAFAPYGSLSRGKPHPRCYGTYPRILGRYVRELGLLTLPEAVRKATSLPASRANLPDRGLLKEGYKADITIFDPDTIQDNATYEAPHQYPEGIAYVIVNGRVSIEAGAHTGVQAGEVLRQ